MSEFNSKVTRGEARAIGVVALLVCAGAWLRFYHLNSGLWFDEIITLLDSVRSPLKDIVTQFPSNNTHLLYSVLARISVTLFGEHPWSLRLPAVFFGVASIPLFYILGREVTTRFEALLAASILTVSYHHIWFSQNGRGYTALLFFVLMATYLLLKWQDKRTNAPLIAYAMVAALGSYTHLTMVFVVAGHALVCAWMALRQGSGGEFRRDWKRLGATFVMSGVFTICLYAPVMLKVHDFFTNSVPRKRVATPLWAFWEALSGLEIGLGTLWIVSLCGGVFCAGIVSYYRRNRIVPFLFFLSALVTLFLVVALGRPIFPRFFFFLAGFILLVVVRGAGAIGTWVGERSAGFVSGPRLGRAAAGLLSLGAILLSVLSLPYGYRYPKQDYQGAVEFVNNHIEESDQAAVIGITAGIPIIKYLKQPWNRIDRAEQLRELRAESSSTWLVYTFPMYIKANQPELWAILQSECALIKRFDGTVAGGDVLVFRWPPFQAINDSPSDL